MATAELLYAHQKECGSYEYEVDRKENLKKYYCRKCKAQVAEEVSANDSTSVKPEEVNSAPKSSKTRKAA